jgi:ribosome-associated toxin RatA of RatAB toxin-antitoxin module
VYAIDRIVVHATLQHVFDVAADVERWPAFLPHYRWVRVLQCDATSRTVEMAAWRPFGFVRYPTWWVSEMRLEPPALVRYRHIRGITRGMDVAWQLAQDGEHVRVTVVHDWPGPGWPLVGHLAATCVIGPVFVHGIARRTLAGVKRQAEAV